MVGMRRRELLGLLGGAAAWPLATSAQPVMPVIGYFSGRSAAAEGPLRIPFLKALEAAGFVAERNVAIEYRFAERTGTLPTFCLLSHWWAIAACLPS
jgi:hypothetical protein